MSALFDSARFVMSVSELMGLPETELPEIAFAGRSTPESQRRLTFFAVSLAWPFLLKLPEERSF